MIVREILDSIIDNIHYISKWFTPEATLSSFTSMSVYLTERDFPLPTDDTEMVKEILDSILDDVERRMYEPVQSPFDTTATTAADDFLRVSKSEESLTYVSLAKLSTQDKDRKEEEEEEEIASVVREEDTRADTTVKMSYVSHLKRNEIFGKVSGEISGDVSGHISGRMYGRVSNPGRMRGKGRIYGRMSGKVSGKLS